MKQLFRTHFIGKHLQSTDPFERANAIVLYQFSIVFFLVFLIQLFTDIMIGLEKATLKHTLDILLLGAMPFVMRYSKKLEYAVNFFFVAVLITTSLATMMLNAECVDGICVSRVMFFILMSALLQKGLARILYCCFFGWLPLFYVLVNIKLGGILTWSAVVETEARAMPLFVIFIPIILGTYAIWNHTKTVLQAKETIVKQKEVIEERNTALTDSIHYAYTIQQAKLPEKKQIYEALPESFILFKPKDIVSGDFYWFEKSSNQGDESKTPEDCILLAAADCTGHGVPGALMSMIGSEKLDDAIANTADTSEILDRLNKGIKNSLRQSADRESSRDGMDIALCAIDRKARTIKYSGANRPMWIIRKGHDAIEEIRPTNKAIGGFTDSNQHFASHEIKLNPGDSFYIFTDGYADTFGGKKDKKLTIKKFRELLLSVQDKSMAEQGLFLDHFIEEWRAATEQVDDILVIGVRL